MVLRNVDYDQNSTSNESSTSGGRFNLRRGAGTHPTVVLMAFAIPAIACMGLAPARGPAFFSFNPPPNAIEGERTTEKTARLPVTLVDFACRGQIGGEENSDCLRTIAEQSGKGAPSHIRMIARAEAPSQVASLY
jgi:hypothetical protein